MAEETHIRDIREGEELQLKNLRAFLIKNEMLDSDAPEIVPKQFSNGFSNLTYLIKCGDKEMVLRRPPFGAVKRGHDMGREHKVLSKLYKAFPKAPKSLIYSEDKDILGCPFYIMEKKEGIILNLKEAKKRNISKEDFGKISNIWLDTFTELHNVDFKAVGLEDLGRPNGYVERQVKNWGKQYLKAATEEVPDAHKVMAWMEENQPKEYAHSLIHNDFKYDNIAFENDSWEKVAAVFDWEMCTLGDPLMDLGTSLGYWTMKEDGPLILNGIPSPTHLEGNPSRTELVELYAQKSGRPINNLVFYYVYGLFKIAVIVQQIYYRYHHGMTKDERFAQFNQATKLFCFMAATAIDKKRIDHLF